MGVVSVSIVEPCLQLLRSLHVDVQYQGTCGLNTAGLLVSVANGLFTVEAEVEWTIYLIWGEKVSIKWKKYMETYAFM